MSMNSPNPSDSGMQQSADQGIPLQEDIQEALDPNELRLNENDPNVARDPVCGQLVDKRTAPDTFAPPINQPMETLYFHSAECKAIFEEDPQRFGYNL
ncbi:MAG TPA: hypothetical protein VF510_13330 [Ktedonobacterales bacterium]